MRDEEPDPDDKGVLRKIRWRSEERVLLTFLEWLVPWRAARIVVRGVFILVMLGLILLWFARFSSDLSRLIRSLQAFF